MVVGLGGGYVSDGTEEAMIVAPVPSPQRRHFDGSEAWPGSLTPDDLGLEQAVDGLGQGIVVGISDAADRWHQLCLRQTLGVAHGKMLRAPVRVMDKTIAGGGTPGMDGLLQRIRDETRGRAAADLPADDPARERVDDERHVDEARLAVDVEPAPAKAGLKFTPHSAFGR